VPLYSTNNIPLRIKKLIAEKRRARSAWQRTHTPESRTKYNQRSKKLKSQLLEIKNESFENYIASLTSQDNSIWIPIKNKKKPIPVSTTIRKFTTPPGDCARRDKEKTDLFAEHLQEVFTPHNNIRGQEVDSFLNEPSEIQQYDQRSLA
jgi:hypothetical protein